MVACGKSGKLKKHKENFDNLGEAGDKKVATEGRQVRIEECKVAC